MSYTPYLVANWATGIDVRLQPWLSVDDAQQELYDGYVFRGVMSKRPGYKGYAIGGHGGSLPCESRVVGSGEGDRLQNSSGIQILGNGTAGPYVFKTLKPDVRRGSVRITATFNVPPVTTYTITDTGLNGSPNLTGDGTGTINYLTGVGTVTFSVSIPAATPIFMNYRYQVDEPVMGLMNFVDANDNKILIVGTTRRLNIYNSTTNRLDWLGVSYNITGVTYTNPAVLTITQTVNWNVGDSIYIFGLGEPHELNGNTYIITAVGANSITINVNATGFTAPFSGNGFAQFMYTGTKFNFWSWVNYKDKDGNPRLIFTNNRDQVQYYAPSDTLAMVGDYVNYPNKAAPDFLMYQDGGTTPVDSLLALQVFVFKDRLQFQRTTEQGIIKPQRLRISGTGANSDNFTTAATGAGTIDIPDGNWINGCASNRDDLVLFTEGSTWIEQYTGNDTVPIKIARIDESRGSGAAFGVTTYLNRTTAQSPRGLIISDGYRIERSDEVIPDFSFNDIDADNFELCFVGVVDEDRDHYLIYPTSGQGADAQSNYILTTNYEEDNYAIYRIPLSCMGVFQLSFDVTWNDLLMYPNWDAFAQDYSTWNDFNYSKGSPISIGGGHHGELWQLNVNESEDNPQLIRNIQQIDANTLQITTDWNNYSLYENDGSLGADYIEFEGVQGMLEINDKQYPVINVIDHNNFQIKVPSNVNFSTYTANTGRAIRVIPFTALFKQFNPFLNMDKKVRCGWIYFYVSTTGTNLTRNVAIASIVNATPSVIGSILVRTITQNGFSTGDQISLFGISGTTQLNDTSPFITVVDATSFTLDNVDSSAFSAYTSGGYAFIPENAVLQVQIITNDANTPVRIENASAYPLQPNCTNLKLQDESKKWYKMYVNQVGKFLQLKITSIQAGAVINLHATIYGFQGIGRII